MITDEYKLTYEQYLMGIYILVAENLYSIRTLLNDHYPEKNVSDMNLNYIRRKYKIEADLGTIIAVRGMVR